MRTGSEEEREMAGEVLPSQESHLVGAVVLAAGRSSRMGRPKLVLPWGGTTIIGQVLTTLSQVELGQVVVVTGGDHALVEQAVAALPDHSAITMVYNPAYSDGSMVHSLQLGLECLNPTINAALICLGDQPQMELGVVKSVVAGYFHSGATLVFPSYQIKRGHPWIVDRSLWDGLLTLENSATMRDFINTHTEDIHYVEVNTPSILQDMDNPADYNLYKP